MGKQNKLYLYPGCPNSLTALAVSELSGVKAETAMLSCDDLKTEEFLKLSPFGNSPVLKTEQGALSELPVVLRWLSEQTGKLGGKSNWEKNQVDQWTQWAGRQLLTLLQGFSFGIYGLPEQSLELSQFKKGISTFLTAVQPLNDHLKNRQYLVGDELSYADVYVIALLNQVMRFCLTDEDRQSVPDLLAYYKRLVNSEELVRLFRPFKPGKEELPLNYEEKKKDKKDKKDKKKKDKKKKDKKDNDKSGSEDNESDDSGDEKKKDKKDKKKKDKKKKDKKEKKDSDKSGSEGSDSDESGDEKKKDKKDKKKKDKKKKDKKDKKDSDKSGNDSDDSGDEKKKDKKDKKKKDKSGKEKKHKSGKDKQDKKDKSGKDKKDKKDDKPKKLTFPESNFKLHDFKTFFVNEKDKATKMKHLWENFDKNAYSFWQLTYDKLEDECTKLYMTSNLMNGFVSRAELSRKHVFGTQCIYGEEGNFNIRGVWMGQGTEELPYIKDHFQYDVYKFKKLDPENDKDRKLIEESWTKDQEDVDVVNGETLRVFTYVK